MDEIGNLPYHLQSKLLTAIQQRSVVRVGSNDPIPVDIRLICATNCNLEEMVLKGRFREDLLYRINTIHIEIPPLRDRKEDIIPLPNGLSTVSVSSMTKEISFFPLLQRTSCASILGMGIFGNWSTLLRRLSSLTKMEY